MRLIAALGSALTSDSVAAFCHSNDFILISHQALCHQLPVSKREMKSFVHRSDGNAPGHQEKDKKWEHVQRNIQKWSTKLNTLLTSQERDKHPKFHCIKVRLFCGLNCDKRHSRLCITVSLLHITKKLNWSKISVTQDHWQKWCRNNFHYNYL